MKAAASEGPHFVGDAATVTRRRGLLRGRRPARRGRELARRRRRRATSARRTATTSSSARSCPGGSPARAGREPERVRDAVGPHRRLGRPPAADRLRPRRPAAAAGRPRRGHRHGREPAGVDGRRRPPRPPRGALRGPPQRSGPSCRRASRIAVDVIATDLDGRAVAGRPVRLRAERLDWEQVEGEWKEVPKDVAGADARLRRRAGSRAASRRRRAARSASWPASPTSGAARTRRSCGSGSPAGECRRAATSSRRRSRSSPTGRSTAPATRRRSSCSRPFAPAEGVLTLRRSGPRARGALHDRRRLAHARGPDRGRRSRPTCTSRSTSSGAAPRGGGADGEPKRPTRPAFASGSLDLPVPPSRGRSPSR